MKRSIAICALVIAAIPFDVGAEGRYVLYADEGRTSCALEDRAPGVVDVHMFAEGIAGLLVAEFATPKPDCWEGATWLGDVIPHELRLGFSQEHGIAVYVAAPGMPVCTTGETPDPAYIGYMSFATQGLARSCCAYPILPGGSADGPDPVAAVCGGRDGVQKVPVGTQGAVINADASCPCKALQPLPVEETSWGRVKALYK